MTRRLQSFRVLLVSLALVAGLTAPVAGVELVVALASLSDAIPPSPAHSPGASCAESLKALKAAGLKIIDVKGGIGLAYTLQREAGIGRPAAVAVILCTPAEPEPESK